MTEAERAWSKARYEEYKKAYAALMLYYPFTLENLPGEIWKDIPDYDGDYQESNFGRTKSFKNRKEKILKPLLNDNGYLTVRLSKSGKETYYYIHNLVDMLFIPNPENKPEVNHIDGCKLNNYYENLERVTESENVQHAIKSGLLKIGTECKSSKFTEEQVKEIRRIYIKGDLEFGGCALARRFNVTQETIRKLVNYKSYKNVE